MEKINSIEQLDALGVKICELLQVGLDKANVVIPETLQQIIAWQIWSNALFAVMLVLLMLSWISLFRLRNTMEDEEGFASVLIISGALFVIFPGIILFLEILPALIKAFAAPNLVIIEELGKLAK